MRIALDATYSLGSEPTGVGVYSERIIENVARLFDPERIALCYRPHRFVRALTSRIPENCRRRPLLDQIPLPSVRLFHGLNQRLPAARYRNVVCTFHDLFVMTGEYSTSEFRKRFTSFARSAAQRSDIVIAVSAFTAGQVTDLLGVEPSRIRVIPHGVGPAPAMPRLDKEKIILHVGSVQKRKNVHGLVRAFESVPPPWRLALVGSLGYGAEEILEQIERSPARDRIDLTGYLPHRELEEMYVRAGVFAFPSLDEGFGMPVLDAMARGLPVLTSNSSALPEVGGDAVVYADPLDVQSIREGLLRLVEDQDLRNQYSERGLQRASGFRWESAALKTAAVYRELLS